MILLLLPMTKVIPFRLSLHLYSCSSFNSKLIPKDDATMEVRSRRYGTRTMFNTAANH